MNYINDVPLYNKDEESVNVVIEICPGTSDKNELIEPGFEKLVCVRQVIGKYPFYYGSFPQTYAGDKDPLDFILFTDIKHSNLDLVKVDIIGAIKTVDAGEQDDKIICVECSSKLINVKKHLNKALKFLNKYKGKNADMKIDKKLVSMQGAETILAEAHKAWKDHVKPIVIKRATPQNNNNKNNATTRVRIIKK